MFTAILWDVDDWRRLGHLIAAERGRRWRSRAEFSRVSGVSPRVIDDLETGRRSNYSEATLAAIERALGWEPGSCRRVVQGGRARVMVDPTLSRIIDAWPYLSQDVRILLAELAERVLYERPY